MRWLTLLLLTAAPAQAHFGHVAEAASHDHVLAGAALGAAALAALWGWIKDKDAEEDEADEELEGDPA